MLAFAAMGDLALHKVMKSFSEEISLGTWLIAPLHQRFDHPSRHCFEVSKKVADN
jgi:hypothetical protein